MEVTGETIQIKTIAETTRQPEYPGSWFERNPTKKPGVVIPITGRSHQELKRILYSSMKNAVNVDIAVNFLYNCLKQCEDTLEADWISYGTVIGRRLDKVTPLSLLDVSTERSNVADVGTADETCPRDISDLSICLAIVGVYRIAEVTDESYRRDLLTLVSDHITANGGIKNFELATFVSNNKYWIMNATYKKLIAAIDMFFHKFKNNDWAVLRVGTKESRFKDCDALLNFNFIARLLGFGSPGMLLHWVFVEGLSKETQRIFGRENEEYLQEDSYFPYHIELGICTVSPYSTQLNPETHVFCNVIGLAYSINRCINADMIPDLNVTHVLWNAKLVFFAFLESTKFPSEFVDFVNTSKEIYDDVRETVLTLPLGISEIEPYRNDVEPDVKRRLPSNSPYQLFTWYKGKDFPRFNIK